MSRQVGSSLLLALLVLCPGRAQDSRATLLGVIVDSTGAIVPNAALTVTNIRTDVRYSTESNGEGNYVIPYLPPGPYRMRVEHVGFRAHERGPVELRISDWVRIDVTLSVGRVTETVSVSEATPLLSSTDGSLGTVIDSRRVADLPVAHGNAYHLTQLVPGVSYAGNGTLDRPYDPTHIVNYSMGGANGLRNEITLDGSPNASITAARGQASAAYVPPVDIIGEMRITTAAFDATAGHTEGGVIAVSLKSVANVAHGTAYYNNQRPELFANSWLANARGLPRPDFNYHRWGGSWLGPLRKNRTFVVWGFEGIRERRPRTIGDQTVPTLSERQGDFSALLALSPQYQLYDPMTRRREPAGGLVSRRSPATSSHARASIRSRPTSCAISRCPTRRARPTVSATWRSPIWPSASRM